MPGTSDVTVPLPVPVLVTTSDRFCPNATLIAVSAEAVIAHVLAPAQRRSLQPRNCEVVSVAIAVSETAAPSGTIIEQVVGQSMPAGLEVTLAMPLPTMVTETVCITMPKPAVKLVSASSVNVHAGEAFEQGP